MAKASIKEEALDFKQKNQEVKPKTPIQTLLLQVLSMTKQQHVLAVHQPRQPEMLQMLMPSIPLQVSVDLQVRIGPADVGRSR